MNKFEAGLDLNRERRTYNAVTTQAGALRTNFFYGFFVAVFRRISFEVLCRDFFRDLLYRSGHSFDNLSERL